MGGWRRAVSEAPEVRLGTDVAMLPNRCLLPHGIMPMPEFSALATLYRVRHSPKYYRFLCARTHRGSTQQHTTMKV